MFKIIWFLLSIEKYLRGKKI